MKSVEVIIVLKNGELTDIKVTQSFSSADEALEKIARRLLKDEYEYVMVSDEHDEKIRDLNDHLSTSGIQVIYSSGIPVKF